jgi:Cu+-exporting ATPase
VQTALAVPATELAGEVAQTQKNVESVAERVAREMAEMVTDVICGMPVRPSEAAATSEFNGETYYFCSAVCKARFDAAPHVYAAGGGR